MRALSNTFMEELKSGVLLPLLTRVKKDDTLMLAIRDGSINIYYRGGNILKLSQEKGKLFTAFFDKKYDLSDDSTSFKSLNLPTKISSTSDSSIWVSSFTNLKEFMDFWLHKNSKPEREFQQVVVRENNYSTISNETEYFITDIELEDTVIGSRFDMTAIKWPAGIPNRRYGKNCNIAFIEMKYGIDSLGGDSGLVKHLMDIEKYLSGTSVIEIQEGLANQFNQLYDLELVKFNYSKNAIIQFDPNEKPEFIFLLANLNPRSRKLKEIITSSDFAKLTQSKYFDLKFYISKDAGYAMHGVNMVSYNKYLEWHDIPFDYQLGSIL